MQIVAHHLGMATRGDDHQSEAGVRRAPSCRACGARSSNGAGSKEGGKGRLLAALVGKMDGLAREGSGGGG